MCGVHNPQRVVTQYTNPTLHKKRIITPELCIFHFKYLKDERKQVILLRVYAKWRSRLKKWMQLFLPCHCYANNTTSNDRPKSNPACIYLTKKKKKVRNVLKLRESEVKVLLSKQRVHKC